MQVMIRMEEIYGKSPILVAKILRLRGIDTSLPYRTRISSTGMTIEQLDGETRFSSSSTDALRSL